MDIREFLLLFFIPVFFALIILVVSHPIPDRNPKGHDLGHGCVAIELGGFPYELCPLNP